jgi:hypothetical protein
MVNYFYLDAGSISSAKDDLEDGFIGSALIQVDVRQFGQGDKRVTGAGE